MKLWEKGIPTDKQIEHFTVGNDRELDLVLAKYDALGSIAHAKMLAQIGLLNATEADDLVLALQEIITAIEKGDFEIEDSFEDVHSKIEYLLTEKLGDAGKKNTHGTFSKRPSVSGCQFIFERRCYCTQRASKNAIRFVDGIR